MRSYGGKLTKYFSRVAFTIIRVESSNVNKKIDGITVQLDERRVPSQKISDRRSGHNARAHLLGTRQGRCVKPRGID